MDENFKNKKIKVALIGTGQWGTKVLNAISLISRYEIVGTINSSTSLEDKKAILDASDVLYIAVHPENQIEYLDYGIDNNKHIICESPFLNSLEERKIIYEKVVRSNNNKFIYINYPYIQDYDFLHTCKIIIKSKPTFVSIKASGPNIKDDILKSKKIYSNQAINALLFLHSLQGKDRLENFNIVDDSKGYVTMPNGTTYEFSWGLSDEPNLELEFKNSEKSESKKIYYDQYDQIIPLLLMLTNKVHNLFPILEIEKMQDHVNSIWSRIVLTSILSSCSSEYFSDIFTNINKSELPFSITNPLNLYLNGGFNN